MNLSMHNQALLRGILAGAVVLSGASACSRSDRVGVARDTTQSGATAVTPSDSQTSANTPQPSASVATQPSGDTAVSGYRGMERDTSAQPDTLAASGNNADSVGVSSDTASAEMAGTSAATPLDSAGVTSDYGLTTDTPTAGYSEMARDTSSAAGRGDTAAVAEADTTTPAESDTATDTLTVASADAADSASAKGEQPAGQVASADTTSAPSGNVANQSETERIRPPEDSTEILGNVTSDKDRAEPTSREVPTDAAGAAPIGNAVTGIAAVSFMSRAGARCVVKDDSSDVRWDMADSPVALNPCGTGTMTLSLVKTGEK